MVSKGVIEIQHTEISSCLSERMIFSIWFGKIVIGDSPLNVMDKTIKAESLFVCKGFLPPMFLFFFRYSSIKRETSKVTLQAMLSILHTFIYCLD